MRNNDKMSFAKMQDRQVQAIVEKMAPATERDRAEVESRNATRLDIERRLAEIVAEDARDVTTDKTARLMVERNDPN